MHKILFTLSLLSVMTNPLANSDDIFMNGFEVFVPSLIYDGSFSSSNQFWGSGSSNMTWFDTIHYGCLPRPTTLQVVNDSIYGDVGKFTLVDNDFCNLNTGKERAQLRYYSTNIGANLEYDEVWISWSMKLDKSWKDTTSWNMFATINSQKFWANGGIVGEYATLFWPPYSSLYTGERTLTFRFNSTFGANPPTSSYLDMFPTSPIALDKWHDMLIHIKFARDSTGFLEYYYKTEGDLTYQLLTSSYDTITQLTVPGYPNDPMVFGLGIYRSSIATDTSIVYYKGYKIGLNRSDVIDDED